jgi:hypothetical protein
VAELDELVAVLEGPGSCPVLCDGVAARGMLNTASSPTAAARGRTVEITENLFFIAKHRLPALSAGSILQIGAIDAAAVVEASDPKHRVVDRTPQDDGLMHKITLDGGYTP